MNDVRHFSCGGKITWLPELWYNFPMNENIKSVFQIEKTNRKSFPWLALALSLFGVFSYLALAAFTEMAQWVHGVRSGILKVVAKS